MAIMPPHNEFSDWLASLDWRKQVFSADIQYRVDNRTCIVITKALSADDIIQLGRIYEAGKVN